MTEPFAWLKKSGQSQQSYCPKCRMNTESETAGVTSITVKCKICKWLKGIKDKAPKGEIDDDKPRRNYVHG